MPPGAWTASGDLFCSSPNVAIDDASNRPLAFALEVVLSAEADSTHERKIGISSERFLGPPYAMKVCCVISQAYQSLAVRSMFVRIANNLAPGLLIE